jgi:hypothetical protein
MSLYGSVKRRPLFEVFENRNLRRIFGSKRDEMIRGLKKFYYEELHDSSPNIIRIIKSWRMRWAVHVATHGNKKGMHTGFWWESQKEREY